MSGTSSVGRSASGSGRASGTFGPHPLPPHPVYESGNEEEGSLEGSQEAAEREDNVGLLTSSHNNSRRSSLAALRHRASNLSQRLSNGSRSRSNSRHSGSRSTSRSTSISGGSHAASDPVRSRAQSLIQAAARSSSEVAAAVRSRASSGGLASPVGSHYSTPLSQGQERSSEDTNGNHTFGRPIGWVKEKEKRQQEQASGSARPTPSEPIPIPAPQHAQTREGPAPSESEATELGREPSDTQSSQPGASNPRGPIVHSDISAADPSFITNPASVEGTVTESTGQSASTFGWAGRHYPDPSTNRPV